MIRILLSEKQAISRAGLRSLLKQHPDFDVIAAASNEKQTWELVRDLRPDVLLLDLAFSSILREIPDLSAAGPATVVLAYSSEKKFLFETLQLGARGVLLREFSGDLLAESIRSVAKGRYWAVENEEKNLGAALRRLRKDLNRISPQKTFGLTSREIEVIRTVVGGHSNREIAVRMKISEASVKKHMTGIFDKTGAGNRLELALFAMHHGLVRRARKQKISAKRIGRAGAAQ